MVVLACLIRGSIEANGRHRCYTPNPKVGGFAKRFLLPGKGWGSSSEVHLYNYNPKSKKIEYQVIICSKPEPYYVNIDVDTHEPPYSAQPVWSKAQENGPRDEICLKRPACPTAAGFRVLGFGESAGEPLPFKKDSPRRQHISHKNQQNTTQRRDGTRVR